MNRRIAVFMVLSFIFLFRTQVFASPLDAELQKLKQAGISTTIEELNLPNIPDSENGALLYKEATDLIYTLVKKYKEFQSLPVSGSVVWENVPEEKKKKVADMVLHNPDFSKVYQLLEKASDMESMFFSKEDYQRMEKMAPEDKYDTILKPAANLRVCARFLVDKATIESNYGDINDALHTCLTVLKIGKKSLSNEPLLVPQFTRLALYSMAIGGFLERVMKKGEGDSKLYQAFIDEIQPEINVNIINYGLKGELVIYALPYFSHYRKLGKESFEFTEGDKKELEEKGKGVPEETLKDFERSEKRYREILKEAYFNSGCKNPDDFFAEQENFYLEKMLKAILLTEQPFWKAKDGLQKIDKEIREAPKEKALLAQWLCQVEAGDHYLTGGYTLEVHTDAYLGAAELGLANRIYRQKYGKFADSLSQLTPDILPSLPLDPFTGKDYIYRMKDKGFIIYSVADNLKDDDGIPQFSEQGKKDDFDIVWENK